MSEPYDVTTPFDRSNGLRRLRERTGHEWVEPAEIPAWANAAARALYPQMERIEGEAMTDAQVEQDAEAGEWTWCRMVAEVIEGEFRKHGGGNQ